MRDQLNRCDPAGACGEFDSSPTEREAAGTEISSLLYPQTTLKRL
ncbi:hypothetical protein [Mesobacillus foraminis]|nr:hypothetical protein [Mesobacillus foraminis]